MGALAWSGMSPRRSDYEPMLPNSIHIPPAYCYRCWFNRTREDCSLECADALEAEILCQGPETVAAFIAEPISGASLCCAMPRRDYFQRIKYICDKYDVLLILDEVMTGFGRSGTWFGYEHFGITPDIMALGKGLGGGYFPIGAIAVTSNITDTIAQNSGIFSAGFSWACNPTACVVAAKTIDYLREHRLIEQSAEKGKYLYQTLEQLIDHPTVGDIRGKGLMAGIEFVKDKETKQPIDSDLMFRMQLAQEALERGLFIEVSSGCDRGQPGDMMMFGPPFIITNDQIDEIVGIFDEVLTTVEKRYGL